MRAFDVRTGKKLWQFNTIPRPGEFGNETWENDSWACNGNVGVWTQISVDEELGLVYLPVETPTSDFYGGHRPGNNLFAESLVARRSEDRAAQVALPVRAPSDLELRHLLPRRSSPTSRSTASRSRPWRMPSKQALLYVFDRVTGQPVWPIEERPVPQSDVPGEKTSPTQPHPDQAAGLRAQHLKVPDDLIDFTPELRAQALEVIEAVQVRPIAVHPADSRRRQRRARRDIGHGTAHELAGRRVRSGNAHRLRAGRQRAVSSRSRRRAAARVLRHPLRLGHRRASRSARCWDRATAAPPTRAAGRATLCRRRRTAAASRSPRRRPPGASGAAAHRRGAGGAGLNVQGLPLVKPPYGVLAAINLDRGELLWQMPHGDTPDNVRNHPALKGLNIPKTGQTGRRRAAGHQDARRHGRPAGDDAARSIRAARCCAPTTRRPAQEVGAV